MECSDKFDCNHYIADRPGMQVYSLKRAILLVGNQVGNILEKRKRYWEQLLGIKMKDFLKSFKKIGT